MSAAKEWLEQIGLYVRAGFALIVIAGLSALSSLVLAVPAALLSNDLWFFAAAALWPIILGRAVVGGALENLLPGKEAIEEARRRNSRQRINAIVNPGRFDRTMNWLMDKIIAPIGALVIGGGFVAALALMIYKIFAG